MNGRRPAEGDSLTRATLKKSSNKKALAKAQHKFQRAQQNLKATNPPQNTTLWRRLTVNESCWPRKRYGRGNSARRLKVTVSQHQTWLCWLPSSWNLIKLTVKIWSEVIQSARMILHCVLEQTEMLMTMMLMNAHRRRLKKPTLKDIYIHLYTFIYIIWNHFYSFLYLWSSRKNCPFVAICTTIRRTTQKRRVHWQLCRSGPTLSQCPRPNLSNTPGGNLGFGFETGQSYQSIHPWILNILQASHSVSFSSYPGIVSMGYRQVKPVERLSKPIAAPQEDAAILQQRGTMVRTESLSFDPHLRPVAEFIHEFTVNSPFQNSHNGKLI